MSLILNGVKIKLQLLEALTPHKMRSHVPRGFMDTMRVTIGLQHVGSAAAAAVAAVAAAASKSGNAGKNRSSAPVLGIKKLPSVPHAVTKKLPSLPNQSLQRSLKETIKGATTKLKQQTQQWQQRVFSRRRSASSGGAVSPAPQVPAIG